MSNLNKEFKRAKYRNMITNVASIEALREMALLLLRQNALLEDIIEEDLKTKLRIKD